MTAPTVDKEGLKDLMFTEKCPYYTIKTSDNKEEVAKNMVEADITTAVATLLKTLDHLTGSAVIVELRDTNAAGRPGLTNKKLVVRYELNGATQATAAPINGSNMVGNPFMKEMEALRDLYHQEKLDRIKFEHTTEIRLLREEMKDLKTNPQNLDVIGILKELRSFKEESSIKVKDEVIKGSSDGKTNQYAAYMKRWIKADNKMIDLLRVITLFAEQDNERYNEYKKGIIDSVTPAE